MYDFHKDKYTDLDRLNLYNFISLRKRRGLSQEEVAEVLGVSARTVMRWEGAAGNPTLKDLRKMASLFEVSVAYIIGEQAELDHWWNYSKTINKYQ